MGLTSQAMLVVTLLFAAVIPVTVLLTWNRTRGPQVVRVGQRVGMLLATQIISVLLCFVLVNDQYGFFTSWQDLVGEPPQIPSISAVDMPTAPVTAPLGALPGPERSGGVTPRPTPVVSPTPLVSSSPNPRLSFPLAAGETSTVTADGGTLLTMNVHGGASGLTEPMMIHLPAGYATSDRSYPVLELLPGWHAPPSSWISNFNVLPVVQSEQRLGHLGDVIMVIPTLNVDLPRDSECTNVPGGIQAETWLTIDVRDFVLTHYRALPTGRSWAVMGYSTGGYCAAKMQLRDPQWYGTAVSLAGYFEAVKDSTTGDLWGGSAAVRNDNSPVWLVTHRSVPAVDLLVFASKQDKDSYSSSAHFLRVAKLPMRIYSLIVASGGHNLKAVAKALPDVLTWIGQRLAQHPANGPS